MIAKFTPAGAAVSAGMSALGADALGESLTQLTGQVDKVLPLVKSCKSRGLQTVKRYTTTLRLQHARPGVPVLKHNCQVSGHIMGHGA
jgi:hypothetical protein